MAYQEFLRLRDRVAFNQGPYTASPAWTDITKPDDDPTLAVRPGATFATGRQSRNGGAESSSVTITAGNRDGRYTPWNSASPYYPLTENAPYQRDCEYPKGSGTWYPIWGGVMSDCSATFAGGVANANMSFQQRLAVASNKPMRSLSVGQILNTSPAHLWTFDDDAGSTVAVDARGGAYPSLTAMYASGGTVHVDQPDDTIGEFAFGVGYSPGDLGGTRCEVTPPNSYADGWIFTTELVNPQPATLHTSVITVNIDTAWTDRVVPVYSVYSAINGLHLTVAVAADGCPEVLFERVDGTVLPPVKSSTKVIDGEDHTLGMIVDATTGEVSIYFDGSTYNPMTSFIASGQFPVDRVTVGTSWLTPAANSQVLSGSFANLAIWDVDPVGGGTGSPPTTFGYRIMVASSATASAGAAVANAATANFTNETADVRFARICAAAGIPSSMVTTTGTFTRLIGPQSVAGRQLPDVLKELETAECGRLFTAHDGALGLASASAFYTPPRTLTLSATTHFDLDDGFAVDSDNSVTDWKGTRPDGIPQGYTASDTVLDTQGLQTKDDGTLPLTTDDDVLAVGAWQVNMYSKPTLRFKIRVHAAKLHAAGLLDDVLLLSEGDQVTLIDLPAGSPVTEFVGFLERIEKQPGGDSFNIVMILSSWIDIAEFNNDDIGRYAADPDSITLTSTVTSSATSISATTAAGSPPLTNAAGDLPFDISVHGERMTVTAVSGSTSPQTLTVTRGVDPTRPSAKTAGAPIDIWNPGVEGI